MGGGGHCFFCLELSTSISKVEDIFMEKGQNVSRILSFQNFCQYLKVNLEEFSLEELCRSQLSGPDKSRLKDKEVPMCGECAHLSHHFSQNFLELEVIQMKVQSCLHSMYDKMVKAERDNNSLAVLEGESGRLRRKTLDQCIYKLGNVSPRVTLQRVTLKQLQEGLGNKIKGITLNETPELDDNHVPLDDIENSEEESAGFEDAPQSPATSSSTSEVDWSGDSSSETDSKTGHTDRVTDDVKKHSPIPIIPADLPDEAYKPCLNRKVNLKTGKYECFHCPKVFDDRRAFNIHYRCLHLKVRFKCAVCEKTFIYRKTCNTHYKSVHEGIRIKCHKCNKHFSQQSSLRVHQRATGCGLREGSSSAPERHQCHSCEKGFSRLSSLRKHIKYVHLKLREHLCNLCGKGFAELAALRRHEVIHSEVREHLCDLCGKGFFLIGNLRTHRRSVHREGK